MVGYVMFAMGAPLFTVIVRRRPSRGLERLEKTRSERL